MEARATYGRADGQGTFVTLWGRHCTVSHVFSQFDARGTPGREAGWTLYFTLAAEEMGREAGTAGAFVMPAARSYAVTPPASVAGPVVKGAGDWIDTTVKLLGEQARIKIAGWLASGLDHKKLQDALQVTPDIVFQRLCDAKKGIYQQRVVIDDYDRIPGVTSKPYVENGLPFATIPASNFGVANSAYDLPDRNAPTFTGSATLVELKPGEKLYRVTSDPVNDAYARTGGYWTRTIPTQLSEVIGGTAVMPEWNNFQRVYEFTVPVPDPTMSPDDVLPTVYIWEGPTAAQRVSGIYDDKFDNGFCLAGGDLQIFVPNIISRNSNFGKHIKDITNNHKSW